MLKPLVCQFVDFAYSQPPSGGCVLKLKDLPEDERAANQPPSGGCVLKLLLEPQCLWQQSQPPSGGCVLKRLTNDSPRRPPIPSRLQAAVC